MDGFPSFADRKTFGAYRKMLLCGQSRFEKARLYVFEKRTVKNQNTIDLNNKVHLKRGTRGKLFYRKSNFDGQWLSRMSGRSISPPFLELSRIQPGASAYNTCALPLSYSCCRCCHHSCQPLSPRWDGSSCLFVLLKKLQNWTTQFMWCILSHGLCSASHSFTYESARWQRQWSSTGTLSTKRILEYQEKPHLGF